MESLTVRRKAQQKWLANNPTKRLATVRAYNNKNRVEINKKNNARNQLKRNLGIKRLPKRTMTQEEYALKAEKSARERLLKNYGLSSAEYDSLLAKQNFVCAICHNPSAKLMGKYLSVDHNHVTGKVRGLLCLACNSKLGYLESEWYLSAKEYLNAND